MVLDPSVAVLVVDDQSVMVCIIHGLLRQLAVFAASGYV